MKFILLIVLNLFVTNDKVNVLEQMLNIAIISENEISAKCD